MLQWFEKYAPIRMKFRALLAIHAALASIGLITTVLAGGGSATIATAAAALVATIIVVMVASERICRPYVDTVVRMEALAAGDTTSPIHYNDHTDCVGRMTRAMATFRDNADIVKEARAAQDILLGSLREGLERLAAKDLAFRLTTPFPGEMEALRTDFNRAMEELGGVLCSVRQAANSVSTGAGEIRAASDDLALRNEQQAASLEETAAAMNQITGIGRDSAKNAADVQRSIAEAHREANEGGQVVRQAIEAMAAIERSSQEIGQIINVIDGIAFQTNLLALNAGVEAARAGDPGKVFAVVANEDRALAQRSADSAKDIKELITASTAQVSGGVGLVGNTGELLEKIVARVGAIAEAVTEIAQSTENQATNLQQVNSAVGDMDRMTQQNAAMVEESTAASRSLADEARELTALVAQFRTGTENAAMVSFPAPAKRRKAAAPPVHGNLAVKPMPSVDDDWSEF